MSRTSPLYLVLTTLCLGPGLAVSLLAQDAAPADRNPVNTRTRPGDMMADSPVTFPERGALPSLYPPDVKTETEPTEEGYYLFSSPCRSLEQIAAIQAAMPAGTFTVPANDWRGLTRTREILSRGGDLQILALGDSIVNDTMRSGWVALLQQAHPRARIQTRVYVRGGGGCQHYREEGRVARHIVPRKPDLVLIGGISQKSIADIQGVIHQLREAMPEVEILLFTGTYGTVDPRQAQALAGARHSGTGDYGRRLNALARAEHCAYLDMTGPWAEYIVSSGLHPHRFYRDAVHANAYGEQILARILMAYFQADSIADVQNLTPLWAQAEKNGDLMRRIFIHCRDFVRGWLAHADPATGLIPRNLRRDRYWNGRDSAADNYPFMVLTTSFTDRDMFHGRMRQMLRTERRLTSRVGPLPDDYAFATQAYRFAEVDMNRLIFDASEYVKDGLLPLTEWLGPSPWQDRMREIVDGILEHAHTESPAGLLPSTNGEVGGELMQVLCRLYWQTGKEDYRRFAFRYADYFLFHAQPIKQPFLTLDDHGCEFIGGLSEVYLLAAKTSPEHHRRYRAPLYEMLDRILEIGRNENGLFYMFVNPQTGAVIKEELTDNWGYDYNAYLTVALVDDHEPYRQAVQHALENVHLHTGYPWEGDIADGYADAIESGLNLLNRIPVASGLQWVEHEIEHMLAKQREDGIIEGWHGDGNYARTAIMVALWKTQGCSIRPWRADVSLGAVAEDGVLYIDIRSDWPWTGRLLFDRPRHREYFNLPLDYPRLNQFPEWFTVQSQQRYRVSFTPGDTESYSGQDLLQGIEVHTDSKHAQRVTVR